MTLLAFGMQAAQGATSDAVSRVIQSAAILLELGGALLIAILFAIVGRASLRREYFITWTIAWYAMTAAIIAITVRYGMLVDGTGALLSESAWSVRMAYIAYQTGKLLFWALVCRGTLAYAGRPRGALWIWFAAAPVYAVVSLFASGDLNRLLVWQCPVAIASCSIGAYALFRLRPDQRSVGSTATAVVLAGTAALWAMYLVIFSSFRTLLQLGDAPITSFVVRYNSYVDMLVLVTTGYTMLVMFMEDARQRVTEIEARLASLVTTAPDPILMIDGEQRVLDANVAAASVFGGGTTGASVTTIVAPADRARVQAAIDGYVKGDRLSLTVGEDERVHAMRPDGSSFTAEFTISRLFDAELAAVSVMVRDVTGQHELEDRRRQASTMEAVRQLAGGLAHDFNNLLTTIIGRSQIISRSLPAASPVRDDVAQIEAAASSAARLARGLLALSRREPLDPERLDVDAVVRGLESRVRAITGPGVTCTLQLGADGAHAHMDRVRLESAIIALAHNAIEAVAGRGDVVIETSRALAPQQLAATTEAACISIRDTGPGFSASARVHLFEPFFSTKADGRGLGLATTWAFAHQSGGTVDVESGSKGTTVRLLFPLATEAAVPPPPLSIVPDSPRRRVVLIAEDEESVRRSVKIFLERAGFEVVAAADGVEALAAFDRSPDDFGMLLTDVMMPQMGGRELAEQLMARRPDLRIVFMSGFLRDPEVLRMVNDRRVRFLAKPFNVDDLVSTVRGELDDAGTNAA